MYSNSNKFICHLADSHSNYKNLFTATQPENARTILAVNSPLKRNTIEKYYTTEEDLETIKGSLLEIPHIFTFDQTSGPTRLDVIFEEIRATISTAKDADSSTMIFLLGVTNIYSLLFSNKDFVKFLYQRLGEGLEIQASLMIDEMSTDLLSNDNFGTNSFADKFFRVGDAQNLKEFFGLISTNVDKLSKTMEVQFMHKIAHLVITLRSGQSEFNFLFLPTFDQYLKTKSDKYKQWTKFKASIGGEKASIQSFDRSFRPEENCFLQFVQENMPGSKVLFALFAESSPDYFKDMLPILEELSRLRVELLSSSPLQNRG